LYSTNLSEEREITIYLPKAYSDEKDLPIVFSADGQIITSDYKIELDSLIDNEITPKFILVGVHSNENKVMDSETPFRNFEYLRNWSIESEDPILRQLYNKHLEFFSVEVIEYIENSYPISKKSEDRIFYGCSNGAGFGVSMSVDKPFLFDNYICMSMAGGSYSNLDSNNENKPNLILGYGDKEPFPLTIAIDEFHEFLKLKDIEHTFYKFKGGHDRSKWKQEFVKHIILLLNK
jgi:enterochelin esterase-like enzyme